MNNYFKSKWIKCSNQDTGWLNGFKNKTHIYAVYKKPTSDLKTHRLKVRGWKNIFHANGKQKNAGVAILMSDKIDLKIKITRDKEGHYIMIRDQSKRKHNNCKYLCTQHTTKYNATSIHNTNTSRHKRRN